MEKSPIRKYLEEKTEAEWVNDRNNDPHIVHFKVTWNNLYELEKIISADREAMGRREVEYRRLLQDCRDVVAFCRTESLSKEGRIQNTIDLLTGQISRIKVLSPDPPEQIIKMCCPSCGFVGPFHSKECGRKPHSEDGREVEKAEEQIINRAYDLCEESDGLITITHNGLCKAIREALRSEAERMREERNLLLEALLKKRSVDGLNGRVWNAGKHLEAEKEVESLLARIRGES